MIKQSDTPLFLSQSVSQASQRFDLVVGIYPAGFRQPKLSMCRVSASKCASAYLRKRDEVIASVFHLSVRICNGCMQLVSEVFWNRWVVRTDADVDDGRHG